MKKKIFIGTKLSDPSEKLTRQIKITLPKNYIHHIDQIAGKLNIKRRYVIWDAIGSYIQTCKRIEGENS